MRLTMKQNARSFINGETAFIGKKGYPSYPPSPPYSCDKRSYINHDFALTKHTYTANIHNGSRVGVRVRHFWNIFLVSLKDIVFRLVSRKFMFSKTRKVAHWDLLRVTKESFFLFDKFAVEIVLETLGRNIKLSFITFPQNYNQKCIAYCICTELSKLSKRLHQRHIRQSLPLRSAWDVNLNSQDRWSQQKYHKCITNIKRPNWHRTPVVCRPRQVRREFRVSRQLPEVFISSLLNKEDHYV